MRIWGLFLAILLSSLSAQAEEATCSSQQIAAAYAQRRAVVVVEGPTIRESLGLVVGQRRWVLTRFFTVEAGRGIEVRHGGHAVEVARIVAVDEAHDLALLELAQPLPVTPLALSVAPLGVGSPVVALTQSWDEVRPRLEARPGVVSRDEGAFATTALGRGGSEMAPVFDCEGRVIGLGRGYSERFTSVEPALALMTDQEAEQYAGSWSMMHMSLTMPIQVAHAPSADGSRDVFLGMSVGTALIGDDAFYFPMRVSFLALPREEGHADGRWHRRGARVQGDFGFGYRMMLSGGAWATYLVPQIGLAGGYEWIEHQRAYHTVAESPCSPSRPCATERVSEEWSETRMYLRPTLGMALQTGILEVHYQLMIDPERPEGAVHQLGMGLAF